MIMFLICTPAVVFAVIHITDNHLTKPMNFSGDFYTTERTVNDNQETKDQNINSKEIIEYIAVGERDLNGDQVYYTRHKSKEGYTEMIVIMNRNGTVKKMEVIDQY